MQRVLVIGPGGAGKTWLSTELGKRTGLPVIHLDRLYWHPGWVPTPKDEWRERVTELLAADRWVMDGNYGATLDLRLERADTVVFLDMPRIVCVARVVRRRLLHLGRTRRDVAPGCPERLTWDFLSWIWSYPTRRRADILQRLEALPADRKVFILRSRRDVRRFLADIAPQQTG